MPTEFMEPPRLGGWHLEWRNTPGVPFAAIRDLVLAAEAAGALAFVVGAETGGYEPLTLSSALAAVTSQIGLVAGIDPLVVPPYTAARRLAALDHASNGRAGWRLARTLGDAQRREYVQVVRALWDSWAPDAHRCDKAAGVYIDTARVHAVRHEGPHYTVAGPLDIPRPPQGWLPLYALGEDAAAGFEPEVTALDDDNPMFGLPRGVARRVLYRREPGNVAQHETTNDALLLLPPDEREWSAFIPRLARAVPAEHQTLRARLQLGAPASKEAQ